MLVFGREGSIREGEGQICLIYIVLEKLLVRRTVTRTFVQAYSHRAVRSAHSACDHLALTVFDGAGVAPFRSVRFWAAERLSRIDVVSHIIVHLLLAARME